MSETVPEVIDGQTGELVPYTAQHASLFRSDEPDEILARASLLADQLAAVINKQELFKVIQGRKHVKVEGWTLLGSLLGVFPICVWTRPLDNGWEARVEARTRTGELVGSAESQCTRDENMWSREPKGKDGRKLQPRDDHALRSMAQTRATSKALKLPLGFIMQLAGFNPTPAEEMPEERSSGKVITKAQQQRLWTIARGDSVPETWVRDACRELAGVESTGEIPRDKYEAVVERIQSYEAIPV